MPNEPRFEFLFEISASLEPAQIVGETPHGNRRIVVVQDGSFEGPRLKGKVLPGGGDWLLVRPDGVTELDVRGTLQTDDGALIYISYRGYRVPRADEDDYFVITPYFETGAPQYAWLQQIVAIGKGQISPGRVSYHIYAVL